MAHIGQYALIRNNEGKLLLLQRQHSKTWCLPGGRLNENEEWDDALLRELHEEINLDCNNPKPIDINILKDEYQTKYCVYFSVNCADISQIKISNEHINFDWFNINEIQDLNIEDDKIKETIIKYLD